MNRGDEKRTDVASAARGASVARARSLRLNITNAERKLWYALRDRRFANYKFRRQVPVGPYIADFICYSARLVIEVDGGQHAESARDARRDRWFAQNRFRVLRFWNNDVFKNLEGVLTLTLEALEQPTPRPARVSRGHLSSARGEGIERAASSPPAMSRAD
jgi:very-short-patch-repair endonuclease